MVRGGVASTYSTEKLGGGRFNLTSDNHLSMRATTMCDPFIGTTSTDMELPLMIEKRGKMTGENDANFEPIPEPMAPTGVVTIRIPKGTNTYGRCQSSDSTLDALTFHTARPGGGNAFDRALEMEVK